MISVLNSSDVPVSDPSMEPVEDEFMGDTDPSAPNGSEDNNNDRKCQSGDDSGTVKGSIRAEGQAVKIEKKHRRSIGGCTLSEMKAVTTEARSDNKKAVEKTFSDAKEKQKDLVGHNDSLGGIPIADKNMGGQRGLGPHSRKPHSAFPVFSYQCMVCQASVGSQKKLKIHMKTHVSHLLYSLNFSEVLQLRGP